MARYPEAIEQAIAAFSALPGVGRKTAERYVFFLLRQSGNVIGEFAKHLQQLPKDITTCSTCFRFTQQSPCNICGDSRRDQSTICVVADTTAVQAVEQTGDFYGVYHVLGGVIDQLSGIGPAELHIAELIHRVETENSPVKEIILALNSDIAGETTSLYVRNALGQSNSQHVTITRLARGLPAGSEIEFADDVTLGNALKDRRAVE